MTYLEIILNLPVNQGFTYSYIPPENEKPELIPEIGKRAEIMFGNKKTEGFIINVLDHVPENCPVEEGKIRPIKRVIDKEPLFGKELIDMAAWISHYYLCTLGEAVFSMIPSGRRESSAGGFSFEEEVGNQHKNELSEEQIKAVNEILSSDAAFHYLYGPTGTGKTEVFLSLAEKILEKGKGVIYLVPEIGLTGQVAQSVYKRFGDTAAIIHSGLSPSQRLKEWHRIMHKEARVVVGARSAIFAPVPDLGLIIIDEEHDSSYKSGSSPRYHARQTAMYRCTKNNCPLVMGSATPSVEAWHLMESGRLIRHTLTKRLAGGKMPLIKSINLSSPGNGDSSLSPELVEQMHQTLNEKKQIILFLNRRGFTHFFRCNSCGYEMKCKNCSVNMTFHKVEKRLRCHYCGYSAAPPQQCPECGSLDIGYSGFGTEFIESEVKAKFPQAKVLRIDTDSLTHKGELQEKIDDFRSGKYDILLGTQMVAKGLNFPNLQLVGVVLADTALHLPDFRASERCFSLITQVAGRAGRFFPDGKVLVQSFSPDREPIACAVNNEIDRFYKNELSMRSILGFPPFTRLLRLVFRSKNEQSSKVASNGAYNILKTKCPSTVEILGPAECPLEKVNNNFRMELLLRGQNISEMQKMVSEFIWGYKAPNDVYIEVDVDPVALL